MSWDKIAGLASAIFFAFAGFVVDHWQVASGVFLEYVWQRLFVNLWYVWGFVLAYGVYAFVRFLIKLHRDVQTSQKDIDKLRRLESEQRKLNTKIDLGSIDNTSLSLRVTQVENNVESLMKDMKATAIPMPKTFGER